MYNYCLQYEIHTEGLSDACDLFQVVLASFKQHGDICTVLYAGCDVKIRLWHASRDKMDCLLREFHTASDECTRPGKEATVLIHAA